MSDELRAELADLVLRWRMEATSLNSRAANLGSVRYFRVAAEDRTTAALFDGCAAQLEVVLARHAPPAQPDVDKLSTRTN